MFQFWYLSIILFFVAGVCIIVLYLASKNDEKVKASYMSPEDDFVHARSRPLLDKPFGNRLWYEVDITSLKATTVIVIALGVIFLFL